MEGHGQCLSWAEPEAMSTFTYHPSELRITRTTAEVERHNWLNNLRSRLNPLDMINADVGSVSFLDLDSGAMAAACGIGALLTLVIALGL